MDIMSPFWAVRRMTATALEKQKLVSQQLERDGVVPRFNCTMEIHAVSCVTVGCVKGHVLNITRAFDVPFWTNSIDVEDGEGLILEVREKEVAKVQRQMTWKHAHKVQEQQGKKETSARKEQTGTKRAKISVDDDPQSRK